MTTSHEERRVAPAADVPGAHAGGPVKSRTYVLGTRSKLAALLVGSVLVGVIAVLLAVGLTVLVALAAIGTLAGLGAIARRAVRARMGEAPGRSPDRIMLDPAQQVFPASPAPRDEDR